MTTERDVAEIKQTHLDEGFFAGTGGVRGDGPYIQLRLEVSGGIVTKVDAACNGCPSAIQVTNRLATILKGRHLASIRALSRDDVIVIGGTVPAGKDYYYDLAYKAILDLKQETVNGETQ